MQLGQGRRIGEQTEQLWALIKPFCKRARYMTRAHWQDGLNLLLWQLTLRKQRTMAATLQGKVERNAKKIGELLGPGHLSLVRGV